jgi:hypothetical protein
MTMQQNGLFFPWPAPPRALPLAEIQHIGLEKQILMAVPTADGTNTVPGSPILNRPDSTSFPFGHNLRRGRPILEGIRPIGWFLCHSLIIPP